MHPDISAFSRTEFYENKALNDADTLSFRDQNYPFEFRGKQSRKTWIDVPPPRNESGYHKGEINAIKEELKIFIDYSTNLLIKSLDALELKSIGETPSKRISKSFGKRF